MKGLRPLLFLNLCAAALYAQGEAYLVDNARPQVSVVDLASRRVSAAISTGNESSEILILPNNRFAFVSNQLDNNVAVLDLQTRARVTTIPTGRSPGPMALTPDGRFLYVGNEDSNEIGRASCRERV